MEILAGRARKYYRKISVASIEVCESLKLGDVIHIKGHVTDFDQEIRSIEICNVSVREVGKGQTAGIKMTDYVRKNDLIYRVDNT
ncbi:MAG: hypothetical protein JSW20_06395 [Nitrospiraceae bacterium]|nr:MAG: hypothetical protein JSW20_06395 [Nitrospiraceae bacterium]